MSRVKRNRKRKLRSKAVLRRLARIRTKAHEEYGLIELGLQGIGPRRLAKMALAADSRPPC